MENKLPTVVRITDKAKNTTISNCEFRNCGIEDSGDGTNLIQNRFVATREWLQSRPTWLKLIFFLTTATATAFIARAVGKLWV